MTSVSKIEAHSMNTPDAYPPGTVAVATVHGVQGVRVMPRMARNGVADGWVSSQRVENNVIHYGDDVTDVRPLVVLDLDEPGRAVDALKAGVRHAAWVAGADLVLGMLADQIESQMKPPRIPEPGLWGVINEPGGFDWVRTGPTDKSSMEWQCVANAARAHWDALINPTLIREGINA